MTDEELIDLLWDRADGAVETLQRKYGAYCAAIQRQFLSDSRDVEECLNHIHPLTNPPAFFIIIS